MTLASRIEWRRGRRLALPPKVAAPLSHEAARRAHSEPVWLVSFWRLSLLLIALPMFAQSFQYTVDIPPLYLLSKSWPMLTLPFFAWALVKLDVPYKVLQVTLLLWILGITPLVGIIQLGNGFVSALATTVKVWSYMFVFSAAGFLVAVQPSRRMLRCVLLGLGIATYLFMVVLFLVVPTSAYGGGDAVTKIFMFDPERGYHLYVPMFFGMLLVFYLNRSFWMSGGIWKLAAIAGIFALQLFIYKERTAIAGGMITLVLTTAWSTGKWRPAFVALLFVTGGAAAFYLLSRLQHNYGFDAYLGGSLAVREVSIATAWDYISSDPFRWLIGSGATTRFGNVTFTQIFGNRMFFLADIGWLGVLFEYGLIGVLLLLALHIAGLTVVSRWARIDDPMSRALADYIVYLIIISSIYSVVFTPGELATVIAIAYYFARTRSPEHAHQRIVASHPIAPIPRHIALVSARPLGRFELPGPSGIASRG